MEARARAKQLASLVDHREGHPRLLLDEARVSTCRPAGYQVLYTSAHHMLTSLRADRADNSHERRLARYASVDLLIIDNLGLRGLTGEEPIDLYDIIRERDEKASTIITSNRAIEEWAPLFNYKPLAGAAMDRLLHHAHVIEITVPSHRNPQPHWKVA